MKPSDKEINKSTELLRLQVFISRSGVCSRRKAMDLVQAGKVSVNGKKIDEPSFKVNPKKDKVVVRGKLIRAKAYEYVLLNKPKGCITTRMDRFADQTIYDILPRKYWQLATVGRLDKDTEGLLLLTNDGDTAYKLTHPKFRLDKVYSVTTTGLLTPAEINRLEKGVLIEGKRTAPAKISNVKSQKDQTKFQIMIHEGRKRQIRLMLKTIRHTVIDLKRLSQGPLRLGALKVGAWRLLGKKEIEALNKIK